ncbi:site-specific DNA-methyltransferase [Leptospira kirschneri serovar Pomona]|uniref:Methyltransferase n=1 Tax=Leptospira kirschneri serovar Pomona TaxID=561005 RepID=A0A1T1E399_9LEPT|nr:DNA methylase [Leptospira kirschneri]KXZ33853.1 DNA methylase [Leptospira sp. ZV016]OOV47537.1 site-specific DNA-methyltransferase [Leptospira kirschneri serovar Pomona]
MKPYFESNQGVLFDKDCLTILPEIVEESVDTVFADPPFNIGKTYRRNTNDKRPEHEYIEWSKAWIRECVRVLKPGGALFIYNLPKWNVLLGAYLNELGMEFRHWIAIELNLLLPIKGRLYPSHYSLLYYTKGPPDVFRKIRTPIEVCRHCGREIKDYGGHRKAMNPKGVSLKDIWTDIPPVRHKKFKSENRKANALSTKITDRIIEMSTVPGGIVLDPFGGSGTTYVSCEYKQRNWIGMEIDYCDDIVDRLNSDEVKPHKNNDYIEG